MIDKIIAEVFSNTPKETLYHYTTFKGLFGIVESRELWASDVRYMNDAAEIRHTVDLLKQEVGVRIEAGSTKSTLLTAFVEWLRKKLSNGHLLFAASFRENGNLLSQWRGYSTVGKGVSVGFDPEIISCLAKQQGFKVARCIYKSSEQQLLIKKVVDAVEVLAESRDSRNYEDIFVEIESDILLLTAVLKHPSFEEEAEWRVISPSFAEQDCPEVKFREGSSMIVPYISFSLIFEQALAVRHVYLGPSPNSRNSMNSLRMFLQRHDTQLSDGISYCDIPYRRR
jgi:hypothetical protein